MEVALCFEKLHDNGREIDIGTNENVPESSSTETSAVNAQVSTCVSKGIIEVTDSV